ncbi:TetR/AcrR family transcriptional regulator [Streptomyces sp. NPDC057499]|uniref:TetR/AcrR family transcriptional regulator n=1 Tax=Streptomyces sp. NPDC057499 TaxID=3346150 RepID=UPI0036C937DE
MTDRQTATAARREQITRAAIALLADRGPQGTTFDAICKEAGLSSKRLITYHFSSKDELFAAIADRIVADAETFMRPGLDAATSPRELLAAAIRANVGFIAGHPQQTRALQQLLLNGGLSHYERHHTEALDRLARLLADGQRAGAFRPFDPRVMAAALRASLDAATPLLSTGLDPDAYANELVELFDRAVRPG